MSKFLSKLRDFLIIVAILSGLTAGYAYVQNKDAREKSRALSCELTGADNGRYVLVCVPAQSK